MRRTLKATFIILSISLLSFTNTTSDEGMYPLAQLGSLDLKAAGLEIPQSEIYEPGKVGLTNALVRLGGCTGSFISESGLIITNHHCVFSSVAGHSTPENNYLENGFYAEDTSAELKTGIPCRITLSFDDVSNDVLKGVKRDDSQTPQEQREIIAANIEEIQAKEEAEHPDLEIQVSEMFVGKYYTVFRYKMLTDVRLVYVPPKAVGKFGGETDNWIWPRHNGDFSIVRAYENGKPYKPEKHLKIDANGTRENDFVFILGYPGTTYRHYPAQFLTYQYEHVLPVISSLFDDYIALLKADAKGDKAKELRYAGTIARYSNTTKNFKGKMQGLRRTDIMENRYQQQAEMHAFAMKNGTDREKKIIPRIKELYAAKNKMADDYFLLNQLYGASGMFYIAHRQQQYSTMVNHMEKADRDSFIMGLSEKADRAFISGYRVINNDLDRKFAASIIYRLHKSGNGVVDPILKQLNLTDPTQRDVEQSLVKIWQKSKYADRAKMIDLIRNNMAKFLKVKDPINDLAASLIPALDQMQMEWSEINSELDALMPQLADLKLKFEDEQFVPDANSTLRLTYGNVKGYSPSDAVYNDPYTTIDGIIEKAQDHGDYFMPSDILDKYKTVNANDNLKHPTKGQVVVGILYNLDTTGGNSGSPILNSKGELVGVNFDRAFSATINDFEWNESYSRSIGVDIRYVLYVMKYINQADSVLDELGVDL